MPTKLTLKANERSSYEITAVFRGADDALVVPDSMAWTLTDGQGNAINGRENVAISPLASSVVITLSGADLEIGAFGLKRVVTFEGVYDSSTGGNNLAFVDWVTFEMNDNPEVE